MYESPFNNKSTPPGFASRGLLLGPTNAPFPPGPKAPPGPPSSEGAADAVAAAKKRKINDTGGLSSLLDIKQEPGEQNLLHLKPSNITELPEA